MAKLKKAAVLFTALIMACSAAGCSDTSYTLKADNEEIRAGIYIDYVLSEMSYQISMLYYSEGITDNFFDQKIEDKPFAEYVSEKALQNTKEYVAITRQFDELGLELTADESKEINSNVNDAWETQGGLYEAEGISKESLKKVYQCSKKREKIFDYFYAEGGTEAVSDDQMQTYINDNYLRYKTISITKSTAEDEETKKKENEEKLALRDEYLKKAEELSFEEFDQIIEEYDEYKNAESDEASDSSDEGDENSDSASESESTSDSSESSDVSSEEESSSDDSQAQEDTSSDESSSEADSSESSDESEDSDSSDSEEEEEDPYPNETMVNFGSYEEEDLDSDYGKLLTEINGLEVGKATAYENDSAYYIIIKGDVSERTDYKEDNIDTILQEMKGDEFQTKIDEWVKAIKFTQNEKAIKRYTPETVYEKQTEYYESKNG